MRGQLSLVFGSGDGAIWAFQPRTGVPIWQFPFSRRGVNTPPLVVGSRVYAGHSEENLEGTTMGALVAIDPPAKLTEPGAVLDDSAVAWRSDGLMAGRSQPMMVGEELWVFDDGAKLRVLDPPSGEFLGRRVALGRMMRGSPLQADGKVYAFESNGRWAIYRPNGQGEVEVVSSGRMPSGEECHGSPICSHGRIFMQTTGALYCLQDPQKTPGATDLPPPPAESPVSESPEPAHLQVLPAEVLLKPGQTQAFQVALYNARGQRLDRDDAAQFVLEGPGRIAEDGTFTAANDQVHSAAFVRARIGTFEGVARIRVVPELPWSFSFDNDQVPIPWVGARYRHVTLDDDLLQELHQEDPLGAQLYVYLRSAFINSGRPALTYDNSTPRQTWTTLQRFLRTNVTTLAEAKQTMDSALNLLVEHQVLADRRWEDVPNVGIRLVVTKGTRALEGNGVLTKITSLPKGTRSRCWFGPSDLHDYTIQADVRAQ